MKMNAKNDTIKSVRKVEVLAQVFKDMGGEEGEMCEYLLRFPNTMNETKTVLISPETLNHATKFKEYLEARGCDFPKVLAAMGCTAEGLHGMVKAQPIRKIKMMAPTLGWQADNLSFVAPTGIIGAGKSKYHLHWGHLGMRPVSQGGSLAEWQKGMQQALPCSAPLMLVIGLSFAAPLVKFSGSNTNRLMILVGSSSIGKTSLLQAAQSVFSDPAPQKLVTFNVADGGLGEWLATQRDVPAIIDELGTLSDKHGEVQEQALAKVYRISATSGRKRHSKAGYREEPTRTLVMTTYEDSIRAQRLGQEVRMVNVPVDMAKGFGIFGKLSAEAETSLMMRNQLIECILANYGHAGVAFVRRLTKHIRKDGIEAFTTEMKSQTNLILQGLGAENSASDYRAAEPFAWALIGLQLAIRYQVLPDITEEQARKAISKMYNKTLKLLNREQHEINRIVAMFAEEVLATATQPELVTHSSHAFAFKNGSSYFIRNDRLVAWFDGHTPRRYRKSALKIVTEMSPVGNDNKGTHVREFVKGMRERYYRLPEKKLIAYIRKIGASIE